MAAVPWVETKRNGAKFDDHAGSPGCIARKPERSHIRPEWRWRGAQTKCQSRAGMDLDGQTVAVGVIFAERARGAHSAERSGAEPRKSNKKRRPWLVCGLNRKTAPPCELCACFSGGLDARRAGSHGSPRRSCRLDSAWLLRGGTSGSGCCDEVGFFFKLHLATLLLFYLLSRVLSHSLIVFCLPARPFRPGASASFVLFLLFLTYPMKIHGLPELPASRPSNSMSNTSRGFSLCIVPALTLRGVFK